MYLWQWLGWGLPSWSTGLTSGSTGPAVPVPTAAGSSVEPARRQVDLIIRQRILDALKDAGYEVDELMAIHPPEDTGTPIEAWFKTTDGHGDFAFLKEVRRNGVLRMKVVPDP